MVAILAIVLIVPVAACSDSSATLSPSPSPPTPSPSPGPAPAAASLAGLVTSSDNVTRISGAQVTIVDGPNAGRTATTSNGEYRLSDLQTGTANVRTTANGYAERQASVAIDGAVTLNFQLTETAAEVTFGPGQHRVGAAIAPGRYFSDPASGCYWERQSGTGGTAAETIAFGFVGFDPAQWIVDISGTDHAFQTNGACGAWSNRPKGAAQATIPPGMWLVGMQVAPGTYRSSVAAGCTWERLRDFGGTTGSVIASELIAADGTAFVTVNSGDVGFSSNASCGTWTRAESIGSARERSTIRR
jgi:hypothetical protein